MKIFAVTLLLYVAPIASLLAQPPAMQSDWARVKAVNPQTKMQIVADSAKRTCILDSVTDDQLVCSKGKNGHGAHYVFARADIKTIKLTRYTASTFAGLGIGLGAGLGIGALVGHAVSPSQPNSWLDLSGVGRDVITAGSGVIGAAAGASIGGPTDFLKGPLIYQRITN